MALHWLLNYIQYFQNILLNLFSLFPNPVSHNPLHFQKVTQLWVLLFPVFAFSMLPTKYNILPNSTTQL